MYIVKKLVVNAMVEDEISVGRLYLLQEEKKRHKSINGFPCKATTRPVAVCSLLQKIEEKVLLGRILKVVL